MPLFNVHTAASAPAASKPILEDTERAWKMIPNLHGILAESPLALEAHNFLFAQFDKTSFTPAERQVILLTISFENECNYCVAGHSVLAQMAQVPADIVKAVRDGTPSSNSKIEALRTFTSAVVTGRGFVDDATTNAFLSAGYTKAQILELLIAVSLKVMANYTNHFAHTPYDDFQKETVWTHPSKRAVA